MRYRIYNVFICFCSPLKKWWISNRLLYLWHKYGRAVPKMLNYILLTKFLIILLIIVRFSSLAENIANKKLQLIAIVKRYRITFISMWFLRYRCKIGKNKNINLAALSYNNWRVPTTVQCEISPQYIPNAAYRKNTIHNIKKYSSENI